MMRKPRLREVRQLAHGHTACESAAHQLCREPQAGRQEIQNQNWAGKGGARGERVGGEGRRNVELCGLRGGMGARL